ncbi:MAG: hypothetical protein M5U34_10380 [Chloroflexi bacterium]|nr:hypothetical protein [Chloroflexota bacterium]
MKPKIAALVGLALLWAATAVLPVWAHGGGLIYVAGEQAGEYRVTVWVAPNQVEAGKTLHFTVAVLEDASNDMILDAQVEMSVYQAGGGRAGIIWPGHHRPIGEQIILRG